MTSLNLRLGVALLLASAAVVTPAQSTHTVSAGASYSYVRSNIVPGCSCFSLNGGSAKLEFGLSGHVALMGEATIVHKGGITPDGYDLTQLSYMAGVRYRITPPGARLRPFAEAGAGGANAFGSLTPVRTGVSDSSAAFALQAGAGLEIGLRSRLSVVPVRVDYLRTTFQNGAANHQNDLQISAGIQLRIR